jgi:hypothetical protein
MMMRYTYNFTCRVSESPPLSSKSEWTSVLHLSHTWNFPSIRSLAVRHLFSLTTPVDRVVIGRKYDIEHWLRPAYEAICEREEWLSEAEGERLGLRDVLKIGRARQLLRAPAILREEGERRALLGGVFGDHPSSTADDIPPPRLASASEDDPVQQSLNLSSSVYTENLRTSGDIESLAVREITAATTDSSDDAFGRKPADDHYEAALGPVYAPVTSSIRDQLLRVISEIDLAEEAMMKARVDQQTAEQKQVTLRAQYDSGRGSHTTVSALNTAQKALNDAQQATAAATTYLERAYQNLVLTVSTYCPSLAKSYRISPEARAELMPLLATLTDAERHHTHTATIASQATQHVEYCRAHEDLCSRTCATWHMKEDEDSLHEARAAVANAQKKQEQEKHAKNKLASAHLALAASLSKLIADAIAHEAPTEAA